MGSVFYHYTDTQAFAGIVENAALWATDFRYLNDSLELRYTWDPFVARLRQLSSEPEPGEYSEAYDAQLKALDLMESTDLMGFDDSVFVACFTELRDAVSQWSRYGANGHGIALGFDSERIQALDVPYFHHAPGGHLVPVMAWVAEPPPADLPEGQAPPAPTRQEHMTWPALLQKVSYGDAERDRLVDNLVYVVERSGDKNGVGSFDGKVANLIFRTHAHVQWLPLVKHAAFEDEQEHRLTITEHFGGRTLMQRRALGTLGQPFSDFAQGTLDTVDVRFRSGGPMLFKPYVSLPFDHAALVEVVTGPAIKDQLVEPTIRRILDRNGFRDTTIHASELPYQT
ncbi:DUF2971 domain-containing protein [Mycobacterium intracellulare]|uniref:DUF2971 domain-containing protein n=1 Tax=Mycobacterium intracellulare TaxID=1767 RepID=UPI0035D6B7E6|nr:DUF2971 domain-containing protein [Mycobacterium intracellulare]